MTTIVKDFTKEVEEINEHIPQPESHRLDDSNSKDSLYEIRSSPKSQQQSTGGSTCPNSPKGRYLRSAFLMIRWSRKINDYHNSWKERETYSP